MGDITTVWTGVRGDWALAGAELRSGDDLASAVLISLGTDRLAGPSDVINDGTDDPRGWWGDLGEDHQIGSKLWLRRRAKKTQATLDAVADDIREALAWLIDDKVASAIEVATAWQEGRLLAATVLVRRTGGQSVELKYAWAWEGV